MKTLGRLLLAVVVCTLLGALAMYRKPVWTNLQVTHFGLFLARVQSNYVMTPEGRIHYYDAEASTPGGGIPLVLVHGLADQSESWAPMLKRLKRAGFHVYALDLLGSGRSPKPQDSDYSIATQEQVVMDFIQALGLQKADIGGWSMGGWIALKLALDHPEMIDRIVIYDSAGIHYEPLPPADIFHPTDGPSLQRLADLLEPNGKPLPRFIRRDALRRLAEQQWITDRAMASMRSGKDSLEDRLPSLTQPLLIVWGADDALVPLSVGQKMHALEPKSELDIMEGCGHLAPKTSCSVRVAAATADFLKASVAPEGGVRTLAHMH